jgi:hypothetical protein
MINSITTFIWKNAFTIGLILLSFVIFKSCQPKPQPIYSGSKPKVIEKRIEKELQTVNFYSKEVTNIKGIISEMDDLRSDLFNELSKVKRQRDTVRIIQTQDSIIHVLLTQSNHKDSVISYQNAIIDSQGRIISSQDTLLTLSKIDLKKVKKQRNWSFIANGILTGLLIIK